jgi:hypothetical protein
VLVKQLELEKYKATIKGLTKFGDRRQGTERNRQALDWIEAQLKSYGCTNTERLQYQFTQPAPGEPAPKRAPGIPSGGAGGPPGQGGSTLFGNRIPTGVNTDPMRQPDERLRALNAEQTPVGTSLRENVYCTKVGTTHPEEMYIVSAHMDGIGFGEAANDDGSGTALVMELARIFSMPGVETDRSIRFILWNNEETGLNGAAAYVEQRKDLQGIESPKGSGKYPEPKWLGMIQHDMMMYDHGMPIPKVGADGKTTYVSPPEQRLERTSTSSTSRCRNRPRFGQAGVGLPRRQRQVRDQLPGRRRLPHDQYRFNAVHGSGAIDLAARERARTADRRRLESNWHQPTDNYDTYSDKDFLLGLNAAQTTLAGVAQLAGVRIIK